MDKLKKKGNSLSLQNMLQEDYEEEEEEEEKKQWYFNENESVFF